MATKTTLMTGASRGFGRRAAETLLRQDSELHLAVAVRAGGGPQLVAELIETSGNSNVSALDCDLASLSSTGRAAEVMIKQLAAGDLPPIRTFVGNAGLQMSDTAQATAEGYEMTFGVNVLANHLLIQKLLPHFESEARLMITTSDSHFGEFKHNLGIIPAPRWRPVQDLATPNSDDDAHSTASGRRAYSTSKLAVIYLVHELARRVGPGTEVYSYNPAFVPGTGLARDAGPISRALFKAVMPALTLTPAAMTPDGAGDRFAATIAGDMLGESCSYLDRGIATESSTESYDMARESDLWSEASRLCGFAEISDDPAAR